VPSGSAAPKEVMNERLAELRDATLLVDENIVAQQMGDHGQGVVITNARVMILKAGLTATGSINGQNVTAFKFDEIGIVNLRRGPMGAIIQIVGKQITANPTVRPPENMAIFSGEQKVKKLETLIEKLVSTAGITINRVEWVPEINTDVEPMVANIDPAEPEPAVAADNTEVTPEPAQVETASIPVAKKTRAPRKKPVAKTAAILIDPESMGSTESAKDVEYEASVAADESPVVEATESSVVLQASELEKPVEQDTVSEINTVPAEPEIPVAPRGVQRKSLAEEIFAELSAQEEESVTPAVMPVQKAEVVKPIIPPLQAQPVAVKTPPVHETNEQLVTATPLPVEEYGPNPRLSALMRKNKPVAGKAIALLVVMALMVLAGLAILGRNSINVDLAQKTSESKKDIALLKSRLSEVSSYKVKLSRLVAGSNIAANRMEHALSARDARAISGTISIASHDRVLSELEDMKPPMGLRTAQNQVERAVNERKTVATAISNALTGAAVVDPGRNDQRLKKANNTIQNAFSEVSLLEASLRKQLNM